MANDHGIVGLTGKTKQATSRTRGDGPIVPEQLARVLDASAQDLAHGRTEDINEFIKDRRAKLKAHLDRKAASQR